MYYWFTTWQGEPSGWNVNQHLNEFTQLFFREVKLLQDEFDLKKIQNGVYANPGRQMNITVQNDKIRAEVDRFSWLEFRQTTNILTPIFRLKLKVYKEEVQRVAREQTFYEKVAQVPPTYVPILHYRLIFDNTLVIEFPLEYPSRPPFFTIDDDRYKKITGSHDHHWLGGGMCILSGTQDWIPTQHTIIRGFTAALDWIVFHYNKYGY